MIRNLLIAATAAAVLAAASASTASAKVHVDVNLGLGVPYIAVGEHYPSYPVYDDYHEFEDEDCGFEWVTYKKWNHSHTAFKLKKKKIWTCE
jgi:hypothetical protein